MIISTISMVICFVLNVLTIFIYKKIAKNENEQIEKKLTVYTIALASTHILLDSYMVFYFHFSKYFFCKY